MENNIRCIVIVSLFCGYAGKCIAKSWKVWETLWELYFNIQIVNDNAVKATTKRRREEDREVHNQAQEADREGRIRLGVPRQVYYK